MEKMNGLVKDKLFGGTIAERGRYRMNNDLSTVKVGDWLWSIKEGWTKVEDIEHRIIYAIKTKGCRYTIDGKYNQDDKYPSLFTAPPSYFQAEPKPCEFKKGDRVLVRDFNNTRWRRRYFAWENPRRLQEKFGTFSEGADEWSSEGYVRYWKFCKPWVEGEDE